ncbi:hypothetical protein HD554DRAFT_2036558 [Boletus coccyginus]|nr:hypothetical protein HD554DRAFT_2036558 [Boletus coccyginus]
MSGKCGRNFHPSQKVHRSFYEVQLCPSGYVVLNTANATDDLLEKFIPRIAPSLVEEEKAKQFLCNVSKKPDMMIWSSIAAAPRTADPPAEMANNLKAMHNLSVTTTQYQSHLVCFLFSSQGKPTANTVLQRVRRPVPPTVGSITRLDRRQLLRSSFSLRPPDGRNEMGSVENTLSHRTTVVVTLLAHWRCLSALDIVLHNKPLLNQEEFPQCADAPPVLEALGHERRSREKCSNNGAETPATPIGHASPDQLIRKSYLAKTRSHPGVTRSNSGVAWYEAGLNCMSISLLEPICSSPTKRFGIGRRIWTSIMGVPILDICISGLALYLVRHLIRKKSAPLPPGLLERLPDTRYYPACAEGISYEVSIIDKGHHITVINVLGQQISSITPPSAGARARHNSSQLTYSLLPLQYSELWSLFLPFASRNTNSAPFALASTTGHLL